MKQRFGSKSYPGSQSEPRPNERCMVQSLIISEHFLPEQFLVVPSLICDIHADLQATAGKYEAYHKPTCPSWTGCGIFDVGPSGLAC